MNGEFQAELVDNEVTLRVTFCQVQGGLLAEEAVSNGIPLPRCFKPNRAVTLLPDSSNSRHTAEILEFGIIPTDNDRE